MPKMKIGLEIHSGLNTQTKLFCGCAQSQDSDKANTHTCPICLGHPGSKPVMNKAVLEKAILVALALECKISDTLVFSRKSYFYPDLAKNYQITQYEQPIGLGGKLDVEGKEIKLRRVHIEEDPASLTHYENSSLIDYNRSGNPLLEIVTEPDMKTPEEARAFLKKLRLILEYLDVFNVETCVIKADANVSIEETNFSRVEIKNITGFKEIERALIYEANRQLNEKDNVVHETRGWNSEKGMTYSMRKKETEEDYGYIIDPDLIPIPISNDLIHTIKSNMPELAEQKIAKYIKQGITASDAEVLTSEKKLAILFEEVAEKIDPMLAAKWLRRELMRVLNYTKKSLTEVKIDSTHIINLLELVSTKQITETTAQKIIEKLVEKPFDVKEHVSKEGLGAVNNQEELKKFCLNAITENQKAVDEYKAGNEKSFNYVVGQVMKKTKGKADPVVVNQLIKELIQWANI